MARINSMNFPMAASPSSPLSTTAGAFPLTYPRPAWLFSREELEDLLSSIEIKLSDLRTNKNNSILVDRVLEKILISRESENTFPGYKVEGAIGLNYQPDSYEILLAKLHLAIEIQGILVDWCAQGMEETRKTSWIGGSDMGPGGDSRAARLDEESGVTAGRSRSTSQSSTVTTGSSVHTESPTTAQTTPQSACERATKRRNLGGGDHTEVQGQKPPRLSLVTSHESGAGSTNSAYQFTATDSADTASCTSAKRKWGEGVYSSSYAMTPSSALFSAQPMSPPNCFVPGQSVLSPATTTSEKTPFICPYYLMNPDNAAHKECSKKTYPNPRKLKEHVWRYTRPFRCEKCGEGFGRDKTRAIHMEKKTPCKPRPATEYDEGSGIYEGSREQLRDRKIETAKSSIEIVNILREYEQGLTSSMPLNNAVQNIPAGIMFQDPFTVQQQPQKQQQDVHTMTQAQASYLQGLGLDISAFDTNVPRIVVQPCEAMLAAGMGNPYYLASKGLEPQGWKAMEIPTLQHPTTPPMKQNRTYQLQGTLSPPMQSTSQIMPSPKSPTPELTHNGPSPMPSPCMSIQDGNDDHDQNVIYESPINTPSINITYWSQQKSQTEQGQQLGQLEATLAMSGDENGSMSGNLVGEMQGRRSTSGSFDQFGFKFLENIESSIWDNNYPYRY